MRHKSSYSSSHYCSCLLFYGCGPFALFFFAKPDIPGQAIRHFRAVHRCGGAPAERMRCGRYLVSVSGSDAIPWSIILPKSIGSPDMDSSVSVSFPSVNTK